MDRNWAKKTFYILGLIVQLVLIIGVFLIESLTKQKAGLMRHIYYKKAEYGQTIFTEFNMNIHRIIIVVAIIIMIVVLVKSIGKPKGKHMSIQAALGVVLGISTLLITYCFVSKIAYYYFVIAFEVALTIQCCLLLALYKKNPKHF